MKITDILQHRLLNTGLSESPFSTAAEAVSRLGAVQSQDYAAAKWALGLRVKNSTDPDIERAFNEGAILRTHMLRPTWHFVAPEDIRWMVELTGPRVKAYMAPYDRKLELDDALFTKSNGAITQALGRGANLTRRELKEVLAGIGIATDVQRLAHIVMRAELDGLICSGPRRGKQFTYALMDKRAPKAKKLDRDQSLAELALRYFTSHGPARLADFSWWSGLSAGDARAAVDMITPELEAIKSGGKTYRSPPAPPGRPPKAPAALLLSIYDEYAIAYRDRSGLSDARDIERMITMGNALTSVIVLKGKAAGTWKRNLSKKGVEITLSPFGGLSTAGRKALKAEADRYGRFLGVPAVVHYA